MKDIFASAQFIKGVGPGRIKSLNRLGIYTIRDLLYHFPRRYLDRTKIKTIAEVLKETDSGDDTEQTIQGKVLALSLHRTRRGMNILELALGDATGIIQATWFNQPYLKRYFQKGDHLILSGKIKFYKKPTLVAPEYETVRGEDYEPLHSGRLISCYPLTEGVNQRFMRKIIKTALDKYSEYIPDTLSGITASHIGVNTREAISCLHFPTKEEDISTAREKLVYEELFLLQLSLALRQRQVKKSRVKYPLNISPKLDSHIRQRIPFTLTRAQEKVIQEIRQDMMRAYPMNRLLQGDVGSGKTIVAVYAMLVAIGNHTQTALMAPTEILAEQHYQTITRLLKDSRVRIALLTRGVPAKERRQQLDLVKKGEVDLVIGTHALIQKDVEFSKLALLIIDEQHKFGVIQRETLKAKSVNPHTLIMTATPIPQTLAFTLFGELDVSVIDQLPPGRRPVKTLLRESHRTPQAFQFIRQKISEGRQVYFVYPLIDESKALAENRIVLKSATQMARYLKEKVFPEFNIRLLHGALKETTKDRIMKEFRTGKAQILVSTVVIEVGIDVPNASIMVIDHAERYGLAQLHQLRGRIGRGQYNSYCLLFGDFKTPEAEKRLRIMEETNDGFRIAEEDLRIRGPGEFLGTRQSGLPEFKIADLARDFHLLKQARADAFRLLFQDPQLKRYPVLRELMPKPVN